MKAVAELSVCPLLSGVSVFTLLCKETKMMHLWPDHKPVSFFFFSPYLHEMCKFIRFVVFPLHKGNVIKRRKHTKQIQSLGAEVLCSPGAQQYSRVSLLLWLYLHVPDSVFDSWTLSGQCAEIQSLCVLQNVLCGCQQRLGVAEMSLFALLHSC